MRLRNAACGFALIYLQALPELFISPTKLPQQSLEQAAWKDLARHAAFAQPLYFSRCNFIRLIFGMQHSHVSLLIHTTCHE
jgi:hypothetical protein